MGKKLCWLLILISIMLFYSCAGARYSQFKPGMQYTAQGEIDNVFHRDIPYKKEILTVTSVGFTTGQGLSLIGLQPGLSKGKQVKITAEFFRNINGIDIFRVIQITSMEQTPPAEGEK